MKKDKGTNSDLQNITQKTKDRATPTPLKRSGKVKSSCSKYGIRRIALATNPEISHE